jgi:6-pyruvoyltetrahydropterin/6-carboxytetrahydropterin synthase
MYIISKEFHFSASHVLNGLKDDHPCKRLHGHNYVVSFSFKSETLNEVGFVIDYRELDPIKKYLDNIFDHRHLNDVMPELNPTAENIAKFLFDIFKKQFPLLFRVEVKETPKTRAIYEA